MKERHKAPISKQDKLKKLFIFIGVREATQNSPVEFISSTLDAFGIFN